MPSPNFPETFPSLPRAFPESFPSIPRNISPSLPGIFPEPPLTHPTSPVCLRSSCWRPSASRIFPESFPSLTLTHPTLFRLSQVQLLARMEAMDELRDPDDPDALMMVVDGQAMVEGPAAAAGQ